MADRREYVAAYRAYTDIIIPIGHEVPDLDYAKREAVEMAGDEDESPTFVATRIVHDWEELTDE